MPRLLVHCTEFISDQYLIQRYFVHNCWMLAGSAGSATVIFVGSVLERAK